jgi:hypothetical protein
MFMPKGSLDCGPSIYASCVAVGVQPVHPIFLLVDMGGASPFLLRLASNLILLITSRVARITGMSYCAWLTMYFDTISFEPYNNP